MRIASTIFGPLNFKHTVPAELSYLKVQGSEAFHANEPFVNIFYQKYHTAGYTFWLSSYKAKEDHKLHVHHDGQWTGFKLLLKQHLLYKYEHGDYYYKQGQFSFSYSPNIDANFSIRRGNEYLVFDMMFDKHFLTELNIQSALLDSFFQQTGKGNFVLLIKEMTNSNIMLLDAIEYLLKYPADTQAAKRTVEELIKTAECHHGDDLPEYKIERMYEARALIKKDITRHISNPELSRMVGTNERDFKQDFVNVFSIPPFRYLQYERIKTAKILLKQKPHLSIEEIAQRCGFKNARSFDPTFRANAGMTPTAWRNMVSTG